MDNLASDSCIKLWDRVMQLLIDELSPETVDRWFRNLTPVEITENTLVVGVPDEFFQSWIQDHYLDQIHKVLNSCGNGINQFELRVVPRSQEIKPESPSGASIQSTPRVEPQPIIAQQVTASISRLNPQYVMDEFVVGPSNRFAHAACVAVAERPAMAYNPLFIHGPVGLGKTHLMQAIGHEALRKNPEARVLYITSEKFTNQLINAIQKQETIKFRETYRSVDVLLIDDIHFIAGKEATQEEFFHTFNALYDDHKQIVVSSDRGPKEIINMEERLVSRFEWGLVTDIQAPDFETRSAILRKKALRHSIPVPDIVTDFIAEVITTNIRELEGSLMRVVAYSELIGQPIDIELAKEVLKKVIQETEKKITIKLIQEIVAKYFALDVVEMTSKKRSKNVVLPRQIAMYLTRELTDFSLPEIGGAFGGRDHTTIMHACDKIKDGLNTDPSLNDMVKRLKTEVCG